MKKKINNFQYDIRHIGLSDSMTLNEQFEQLIQNMIEYLINVC